MSPVLPKKTKVNLSMRPLEQHVKIRAVIAASRSGPRLGFSRWLYAIVMIVEETPKQLLLSLPFSFNRTMSRFQSITQRLSSQLSLSLGKRRSFSTSPAMAAAEVKRLGVVGAGQMVRQISITSKSCELRN